MYPNLFYIIRLSLIILLTYEYSFENAPLPHVVNYTYDDAILTLLNVLQIPILTYPNPTIW